MHLPSSFVPTVGHLAAIVSHANARGLALGWGGGGRAVQLDLTYALNGELARRLLQFSLL